MAIPQHYPCREDGIPNLVEYLLGSPPMTKDFYDSKAGLGKEHPRNTRCSHAEKLGNRRTVATIRRRKCRLLGEVRRVYLAWQG